jgi:hypothetical protein
LYTWNNSKNFLGKNMSSRPIRLSEFDPDVIKAHKKFAENRLSADGLRFTPSDSAKPLSDYNFRGEIFDHNRFNEVHLPTVIGSVSENLLKNRNLAVLDMPVLMPESDGEYRLPKEVEYLAPLIEIIAAHEKAKNSDHNRRYAYLTVDQRPVRAGNTQRNPGLHIDGFQGSRITDAFGGNLSIDTQYIVYNTLPTVFYSQPFPVGTLNTAVHNFFHAFEMLVDERNLSRVDPYNILSFPAYAVHRADTSPIDQSRTFLRLTYSEREFDRWGNTYNPMFDYKWNMVTRDVATSLRPPTWEELIESCHAINWGPSKPWPLSAQDRENG